MTKKEKDLLLGFFLYVDKTGLAMYKKCVKKYASVAKDEHEFNKVINHMSDLIATTKHSTIDKVFLDYENELENEKKIFEDYNIKYEDHPLFHCMFYYNYFSRITQVCVEKGYLQEAIITEGEIIEFREEYIDTIQPVEKEIGLKVPNR